MGARDILDRAIDRHGGEDGKRRLAAVRLSVEHLGGRIPNAKGLGRTHPKPSVITVAITFITMSRIRKLTASTASQGQARSSIPGCARIDSCRPSIGSHTAWPTRWVEIANEPSPWAVRTSHCLEA